MRLDYSDEIKTQAIVRVCGDHSFTMTEGDLTTIKFADPHIRVPSASRLEAMCEVIAHEKRLEKKLPPPPVTMDLLEMICEDIHAVKLNKGGSFYNALKPYIDK